jgi:hypothetical protein
MRILSDLLSCLAAISAGAENQSQLKNVVVHQYLLEKKSNQSQMIPPEWQVRNPLLGYARNYYLNLSDNKGNW